MEIKTILCSVDFSSISARVLRLAIEASRLFNSRLVLHHNVDPPLPSEIPSLQMFMDKVLADQGLQRLSSKQEAAIKIERKITRGKAHTSILTLAQKLPADLIVMGTHGRSGLKHMLVGSTTERVIAKSNCPVLAIGEAGENRIFPEPDEGLSEIRHRVLVPVDFSPHSLYTLENACRITGTLPVELHFLHVVQPVSWDDMRGGGHFTVPEFQRSLMLDAKDRLLGLIPENMQDRVRAHVRMGPVVGEIIDCAASIQASLIVMGVTPGGLIEDFLFGAASYGVLRSSPCPVWIVPAIRHGAASAAKREAAQ